MCQHNVVSLEDSTLITETNLNSAQKCISFVSLLLSPWITVVQLSPVGQNELKWSAWWRWMEKRPKRHGQKCTATVLTHLSGCYYLHCSLTKWIQNPDVLSTSKTTEAKESSGQKLITFLHKTGSQFLNNHQQPSSLCSSWQTPHWCSRICTFGTLRWGCCAKQINDDSFDAL